MLVSDKGGVVLGKMRFKTAPKLLVHEVGQIGEEGYLDDGPRHVCAADVGRYG